MLASFIHERLADEYGNAQVMQDAENDHEDSAAGK